MTWQLALEEDYRLDPMAITINETDEAKGAVGTRALFRNGRSARGLARSSASMTR
jgi:hypothetical protein